MKTRTDRLNERLKEKMAQKRAMWSAGHLSVFQEKGWEDKPLILRRAKAIEMQLACMPAEIEEDELIVGRVPLGNFSYGTTFPTYAHEEEIRAAEQYGIGLRSVWGHYVPDYARILHLGMKGIREEAQARLKSLGNLQTEDRRRHFLEAVLLTMDALGKLARRYMTLAEDLARGEKNELRQEELKEIARILRKVPEQPAKTFREAVQSFWLTFVTLHSTMNTVPIGRLDFFLWPFLEQDLAEGNTSPEEAQELVDCLWLKFNERSLFLEPETLQQEFILVKQSRLMERHMALYNHWLQNVMLGGQDGDGKDATNTLTTMCLEASRKFDLTQPTISLRVHRESPETLLELACRVIQRGGGMPSIYNDPVLIEGLVGYGFPLEKARGFSNDGCWEILIPGETEFRWGPVHALQCLEFALTNGRSKVFRENDRPTLHMPVKGIETGNPRDFSTYDALWHAFLNQVNHQIDTYMAQSAFLFGKYYELVPVPFLSSLLKGCLESARDITEGGARYYMNAIMLTGLPNAADSLAAIKTLVFEEGKVTLSELLEALECDFEGHERLRQLLLNRSPKYGNDEEEVDRIGVTLAQHFSERIKANSDRYSPIVFIPGCGTFEDYDLFGRMVGATPDGRKAWSALAPNLGPVAGMDLNGPTALIHSYAKFPHAAFAAGSELDLSMNAKDFEGEEGLQRMLSIVKAFLKTGGAILNIALNDVEILKKAQQHPEEYRNLRVRMGGWSAYFVLLDKRNQDHQIARYSH